jgi:hypothetical protein
MTNRTTDTVDALAERAATVAAAGLRAGRPGLRRCRRAERGWPRSPGSWTPTLARRALRQAALRSTSAAHGWWLTTSATPTHGETAPIELTKEHHPMKQILAMKYKSLAHGIAGIVLGSALLVPVASAESDQIVQTAGGVSYVSGGIGTDSIDRLNSLAGDFNLKLVFALTSGSYVSGVKVSIADEAGKTLLDATSEGPWFLIKLPVGNYQIVATFAGKTENRTIAVAAEKLKTIDLRWASE